MSCIISLVVIALLSSFAERFACVRNMQRRISNAIKYAALTAPRSYNFNTEKESRDGTD